eukprot:scaffold314446_cov30-Tisochrysis_lutea.AAC.4
MDDASSSTCSCAAWTSTTDAPSGTRLVMDCEVAALARLAMGLPPRGSPSRNLLLPHDICKGWRVPAPPLFNEIADAAEADGRSVGGFACTAARLAVPSVLARRATLSPGSTRGGVRRAASRGVKTPGVSPLAREAAGRFRSAWTTLPMSCELACSTASPEACLSPPAVGSRSLARMSCCSRASRLPPLRE